MTEDKYRKADELYRDLQVIERLLEDVKENPSRWIGVATSRHSDEYTSYRFRKDITEFLKQKQAEYRKEFEEL